MRRGVAALLLAGCLERTTGQTVPLDPRFYADEEARQGEPGVGGGGAPFSEDRGPRVTVQGTITSRFDDPVDLDVQVPDPSQPGGVAAKGKLLLDRPGPFEIEVPVHTGPVQLQAFQDREGDGPSGDDPFAQVLIEVGDTPVEGVELDLVKGARRPGGPVHAAAPPGAGHPEPTPAPPGAPGGPEHPPSGAPPPPSANAFIGIPNGVLGGAGEGDSVTLSGDLDYDGDGMVDLDFFQPADEAPGGRRMLGKIRQPPGPWHVKARAGLGPVLLEAFVDRDGNGPSLGDPMGIYPGNPLIVGDSDIHDIDIHLAVTADGRMPRTGVE